MRGRRAREYKPSGLFAYSCSLGGVQLPARQGHPGGGAAGRIILMKNGPRCVMMKKENYRAERALPNVRRRRDGKIPVQRMRVHL